MPQPTPVLLYASPTPRRRRWLFIGVVAALLLLLLIAVVAEIRDHAVVREREEAERRMREAMDRSLLERR